VSNDQHFIQFVPIMNSTQDSPRKIHPN